MCMKVTTYRIQKAQQPEHARVKMVLQNTNGVCKTHHADARHGAVNSVRAAARVTRALVQIEGACTQNDAA